MSCKNKLRVAPQAMRDDKTKQKERREMQKKTMQMRSQNITMRNAQKTQTTKEMKPQMSGNILFLSRSKNHKQLLCVL